MSKQSQKQQRGEKPDSAFKACQRLSREREKIIKKRGYGIIDL